ncbi:hypothetical protein DEO72_LG11g1592 [Vigna unguiculata]|uniref:Uncharacterized protein n=1 Tax=Vigna unguiculata TaxID=3917 RepID=A0A4D6NPX4_VIGUN|nr:hypothetical protein DEO72_LG11g1592 [Vigna unguiculata]
MDQSKTLFVITCTIFLCLNPYTTTASHQRSAAMLEKRRTSDNHCNNGCIIFSTINQRRSALLPTFQPPSHHRRKMQPLRVDVAVSSDHHVQPVNCREVGQRERTTCICTTLTSSEQCFHHSRNHHRSPCNFMTVRERTVVAPSLEKKKNHAAWPTSTHQ